MVLTSRYSLFGCGYGPGIATASSNTGG